MTLSVQRLAFCTQCRCLLPKRCARCVQHPGRKPRVIQLFAAPPILETASCGCVKVRCAAQTCRGTGFKWLKLTRERILPEKNLYCSKACALVTNGKLQRRGEPMSCVCGKTFYRPPSALRPASAYCSPACRWAHHRAQKEERRQQEELAREGLDGQALYYCPVCRDVTAHRHEEKHLRCESCGSRQQDDLRHDKKGVPA